MAFTTVSKKYSEEIQTTEYGFGLEGVLRARASTVTGILNGVDYDDWSPEKDKFIAANYSAANLDGKALCKKDLFEHYGLAMANPRPKPPRPRICSGLPWVKALKTSGRISGSMPVPLSEISVTIHGTSPGDCHRYFLCLARGLGINGRCQLFELPIQRVK